MPDRDAIRFVRTVMSLRRRRASGVLEVQCDERRARLSFSRGVLVYCEHKSLGSTLGSYLVDHGYLERRRYEQLVLEMGRDAHHSAMVAFVELAISRGALAVDQANSILQGQVERNFVGLFEWERFDCRFHAGEDVLRGLPRFPCEIEALALQGVRRRFHRDAVAEELADKFDKFPILRSPPAELVRPFRLQSNELKAARLLDGSTSLSDLWELSDLDSDPLSWIMLIMHASGELAWAESAGGQIVADASDDPALDSGVRPRMESRPSVKLTLPAPPNAKEIEAASAFRLGRDLLRKSDLAAAQRELTRAISLIDLPHYSLYALWVDWECAGRPSEAGALQVLADAARRALVADATLAFAYYVVGHLHAIQRDYLNAEMSFARAARLDPTDKNAAREVEILRQRRHGS
jgi:tetratricopeptide (TPR) repeat protein